MTESNTAPPIALEKRPHLAEPPGTDQGTGAPLTRAHENGEHP